jgi:hypothetical protein
MTAAAVYPNILTIRNFFKTLKNRNKMKIYKINIFKHETRKGNTNEVFLLFPNFKPASNQIKIQKFLKIIYYKTY